VIRATTTIGATIGGRSKPLHLDPGKRYLIVFEFSVPPAAGNLHLEGAGLARHYLLPEAGQPGGFGMRATNRRALSVWTSLPEGEDFYLYNRIKDLSGQELTLGAEEEVLSKYLDEDVYNALNDLPPNFRMAIILADIEGMSYKEIAETLQIPIGTVMSRISRARRQLQQSLWQYAKDNGYVREAS